MMRCATSCAVLLVFTASVLAAPPSDASALPPQDAAAETILPIDDAIARLEDLKRRVALEPTELGQRRAADELMVVHQQLVRQHAGDPRRPLWLADFAEDAFTTALPAGGDVDHVLYGLAGPEPRRRVRALVRDMLMASEQAEQDAKSLLTRTGAEALPTALADRLNHVERPRRIPLLRSLAEVLQVEVGEFETGKRRAMAEAAIARVETLLPELDDRTISVVARYAGLAAARIEDERSANRLLTMAKNKAGTDEALTTLADLAALRAAGLLRGPGSAAAAAGLLRNAGSSTRRLALAELESRLRRQQQGEAGSLVSAETLSATQEWTAPFTDVLRRSTATESASLRDAAMARLMLITQEGIALPAREPMALLAIANSRLDAGESATDLSELLLRLADDGLIPTSLRAAALRTLARIDMADQAWTDAVDRSIRLASEHSSDPSSAPAIALAVRIARELDRATDGVDAPARQRLESAVALGLAQFPEHTDQALWQLEQQTLAAEAKSNGRTSVVIDTPPILEVTADPISDWLRARQAAARAWMCVQAGDAEGALAILGKPQFTLAGTSASRRLASRVAALAELDRDPALDSEIQEAAKASAQQLVDVTTARMAALLPSIRFPLVPADTASPDACAARRLADALTVANTDDAAAWVLAGDLLRLRGEPLRAWQAYERVLHTHPDTAEALIGKAESNFALGGDERLSEAMAIHRRMLAGREMEGDALRRDNAWWLSQLRQLQILQRVHRWDSRAIMQLNRLRALDPALGGEVFAAAFEQLPDNASAAQP